MKLSLVLIVEIIAVVVVLGLVFVLYPRVDVEVEGTKAVFKPISANIVMISKSEDFEDSRYLEVEEEVELNLEQGIYYWKASNDYLEGFRNEIVVSGGENE